MVYKTTGETAKMLGVGLNTVKRWINNGDLRAVQTPGGHWRVPEENLQQFMQARGIPTAKRGRAHQGAARILIVDDDQSVCTLLEAVLEQADFSYEAQSVIDGYTGLMRIGSWRPDVLVLDILMPDMNGLEVLNRIRADADLDDMAIILITAAFDQPGVKQAARSARVAALLPKPLEVQRFLDTIKASLASSFALRDRQQRALSEI